jgi:aerobic-type carbon monoxide dehydrogenase small subunit (CoxS/CutS family)
VTETTSFRLNGTDVSVAHETDETLLHVLRNRLDLYGTRFGCGLEQCGACMVLIDGRPRHACTLPAEAVGGRTVTTIEGLAADPVGKALLQAFDEGQAGQCGYCLSGILISAFALLKGSNRPGRTDIAAALAPHLCRCGAHPRILRAVERAAALTRTGAA